MALVAMMVTLGGYTRLSGAGLSITEWKPVHGTLPPMSATAWEEEFAAYKETPQFQKVNSTMTAQEFKIIYWPEYFHRLLGRLIGFAVLIPFIIFLARKSLARPAIMHIGGIFILGALQGFIGWFMVQSGLVDNPHVSHVRLALHLAMAFAIFGLLEWLWLEVSGCGLRVAGCGKEIKTLITLPATRTPLPGFSFWFSLLCLQIIFGAFMAGLHGGFVYNTWPTMNGKWLPESFSGDIELIQFIHRWLAAAVVGGFVLWWFYCRQYVNNMHLTKACVVMSFLLGAQFLLGVLTLIEIVPLHLALPHQFIALALFAVAVGILFKLSLPRKRETCLIK